MFFKTGGIAAGNFFVKNTVQNISTGSKRITRPVCNCVNGGCSPYLLELLEQFPETQYLGFYQPPGHLELIKCADIGILTYVADQGSINPVYCAPNKIWEYAKFGIPMLCNDIPGLRYTVEAYRMGRCCDIGSVEDIKKK